MAHTTEKIIDKIKELKGTVLPSGKLILTDSDWDMLLLLDKEKIAPSDFDTYAYPFVELGWNLGEYFSMKLYTLSEWIKRKGTPFFKNVEEEGVEL